MHYLALQVTCHADLSFQSLCSCHITLYDSTEVKSEFRNGSSLFIARIFAVQGLKYILILSKPFTLFAGHYVVKPP